MSRWLVSVGLALLLCTASLQAQEGFRRGKIKKIDLKPFIGPYGATLAPKMPVGAVVVPAAEGALAKAIGSHGTDTIFYLKSGVHTGNGEMRPKSGSVFVGEAGAILDGGNATAKCFIHDGGVIPFAASAKRYVVTLRNLVVRNYASADQECAIMAQDTGQGWPRALSDPADRNGWLLDHCTFSGDDRDGLSGEIPAAFRPWDKSPKSGPDLWSGEIMLFNACAVGTYIDPATKVSYSFTSKTWIHGNMITDGGGGILCQYQDRGGIDPFEITADKPVTAIQLRANHCEILDNYIHHMMVAVNGTVGKPSADGNTRDYSAVTHNRIAYNKVYHSEYGFILGGEDWLVENNEVSRLFMYAPGNRYDDCDYTRFFGKGCVQRYNYYHGTDTIVIGGLVQDHETESVDKVPLLGDIPNVAPDLCRLESHQQTENVVSRSKSLPTVP